MNIAERQPRLKNMIRRAENYCVAVVATRVQLTPNFYRTVADLTEDTGRL